MAPAKHGLKPVQFLGRTVPTVLNTPGETPCALVALANVLLLRNSLQLRAKVDVSTSEVLSLVAAKLLESTSEAHKAPGRSAQHSVSDTVSVLPGLGGACPCDVRFTRVHDFAYSPQPHAVFELLDVLLVHGWVVDAADLATRGVVGNRSHSQLLARVAELEAGAGEAAAAEAALLRSFLASGSCGMTPAGLAALLVQVPDRQLCVLYCGGAYRAAFKREDVFYLLLDGADAMSESAGTGVWERLDGVGAPTTLVASTFQDITRPDGSPMQRPPLKYTATDASMAGMQAAGQPQQQGEGLDPRGGTPGAASPLPHAASPLPPMPAPTVPFSVAAMAAMALGSAVGPGGDQGAGAPLDPAATSAVARDHALALRLQESYEEQERAARRAVRQASARLQQQQARGAGSEDAHDVRDFVNRVEQHMSRSCPMQ